MAWRLRHEELGRQVGGVDHHLAPFRAAVEGDEVMGGLALGVLHDQHAPVFAVQPGGHVFPEFFGVGSVGQLGIRQHPGQAGGLIAAAAGPDVYAGVDGCKGAGGGGQVLAQQCALVHVLDGPGSGVDRDPQQPGEHGRGDEVVGHGYRILESSHAIFLGWPARLYHRFHGR